MHRALCSLFLVSALFCSPTRGLVVARAPDGSPPLYITPKLPTSNWLRQFDSPWTITYKGTPPPSWVQAAVRYATLILEQHFVINVPIRAEFSFGPLGSGGAGGQVR